jgi:excinuclease ABC subunit C
VFLPQAKDAIPIRANSAEMFVLQRLRDEAHRFAVTFHRSQRKKRTLHSELSRAFPASDPRASAICCATSAA